MMEAVLPRSWKEEFAFAAAMREEDILYREKMARLEVRQRTMRETERVNEQKREREFAEAINGVLASDRQITAFRAKLDRYDEKTVVALMENREALDEVQKWLDDMLGKAHVLPDGRRVFKTQDGTRVFDETGLELKADVIDPDQIADHNPKWEVFKAANDKKLALELERKELLDYQARIDAARETLDKDGVTAKELDGLDADLDAAMPEAVRRKLGIEGPTRDAEGPSPEPSNGVRAAVPPNDQRPSAFSPM